MHLAAGDQHLGLAPSAQRLDGLPDHDHPVAGADGALAAPPAAPGPDWLDVDAHIGVGGLGITIPARGRSG